jgi:GT2 family glycosyltransferase
MLDIDPVISFIIPTYKTPLPFLRDALDSVIGQTSANWEICIGDDGSCEPALTALLHDYAGRDSRIKVSISERNAGISSASNRAAALATGAYLALLDHDDVIAPQTVAALTEALRRTPNADVLYSDEVKTDEFGKVVGDYVKPDYSVDFLRSTMYVGHLFVLRRGLFESLGGLRSDFDGSQDFDLALRACTRDRVIVHVPQQLYSWRGSPASTALDMSAKPWAVQSAKRVIDDFAAQLDWPTHAEEGMLPATFRLRYAIKPTTTVRIVIVCNGGTKRLSGGAEFPLLVNAFTYLTSNTSGIDFQISAVAGESLGDGLMGWCAAKNIALYQSTGDDRRSVVGLLNAAIGQDDSSIIVLIRDNIELLYPQWLTAMVELAQMPDIGVVGPRVSYEDGSVRHAGLVYADREIKRCFHHTPVDVMEYQGFAHMIRNYSAVSMDCMAFRRDAWESLGGFDELFESTLFDADFCLRAALKGLRVVFTPFSHVKFIGIDKSDEASCADRKLLADRYSEFRDPFFSPQIILSQTDQ